MSRILIADDSAVNRRLLGALFRAEGFAVELAEDGGAAVEAVRAAAPDAVLLDVRMPGLGGLDALAAIKKLAPRVPVVMLTAHGDIAEAVEATRRGAVDFLVRPVENAKLVLTIRRALERQELESEIRDLRGQLERGGPLAQLIGTSAEMQAVLQSIRTVAASELSVVIQGETGTGKELVARAVHQLSARRSGPFVAVDCGAIPDTLIESELFGHERGAFTGAERRKTGRFKEADAGTLFFDEIGNLPLGVQPKLLRALQERTIAPLASTRPVPVNVRLIAATNEDLSARVAAGAFREDLFYRLDEFAIALPPLRARTGDVPLLARHFVDEAATELRRNVAGLTEDALRLLESLPWPGNVRQLRNVVRQAVLEAAGPWIGPADLRRVSPARAPDLGGTLRAVAARAVAEAERQAILTALRQTGGNKSRAARLLHVDFKTLHAKMRRYGIRGMEPAP